MFLASSSSGKGLTAKTDVSRPSALPSANLIPRANNTALGGNNQPSAEQSSREFLTATEEEWNRKIDVELEALLDGMVDLVGLASIGDKDKFRIAQEAFQAQSRAESMVRAANSLLSITHSMKLLLLLSDEAQITTRRDDEIKVVQEEKNAARAQVAALLDELIRGGR
ncbi:hypothetical protein HMN09_01342100 [Mycena chlorophos]|uniref:Uncharacterized protein n=2 Tax=Mycena chlorophos TaxID=658473 RepID=A0ABQ0LSC7_MYCCL|nr:hypothetical protein HMN09_01342100 [Mycena chlorophos]GAT53514.1 predicted protein [Mycena chlorophos]